MDTVDRSTPARRATSWLVGELFEPITPPFRFGLYGNTDDRVDAPGPGTAYDAQSHE
jgi:hypothetical protein